MAVLNKEIAIPSACSAVVAAMSLVFYAALVQVISTPLMAEFVALSALAAMIQIAFVPQAWLYVLGAAGASERRQSLVSSAVLEWCGIVAGLVVALPLAWLSGHGAPLVGAYLAFCMGGSTAVQGFLRGDGRWWGYSLSVTLPSALRLVYTLAGPALGLPMPDSLAQVVITYLLIPEGLRYGLVTMILLRAQWQRSSVAAVMSAFGPIFRNWFYDIGSASVEVGDKYLLSLVISPSLLVVYFFVRKMSTAMTIILEPFYSHRYRHLRHDSAADGAPRSAAPTLAAGYGIAVLIAGAVVLALLVLRPVSLAGVRIVPPVIVEHMLLFSACLLIDAGIAANRWGRYVSLINGGAVRLLLVRIACLCLFIAVVSLLAPGSEAQALVLGFLAFALAELLYVSRQALATRLAAPLVRA